MRLKTELIRQTAKDKGLSYRKMAVRAGLSLSTISLIFRGASCSAETANRIAELLETPLSTIAAE